MGKSQVQLAATREVTSVHNQALHLQILHNTEVLLIGILEKTYDTLTV